MSHANGRVRFGDGTVYHYEYDGTSDIVCNCLYNNYEDMIAMWRNQPHNKCKCGNDEPVVIATDYGGGFWWPGRACKTCKAITKGLGTGLDETLYDVEYDGLPDWWV